MQLSKLDTSENPVIIIILGYNWFRSINFNFFIIFSLIGRTLY